MLLITSNSEVPIAGFIVENLGMRKSCPLLYTHTKATVIPFAIHLHKDSMHVFVPKVTPDCSEHW